MAEKNYDFRFRMDHFHRPGMLDKAARPEADETVISANWRISYDADAPQEVIAAAKDLQDFFLASYGLPLVLAPGAKDGIYIFRDDSLPSAGAVSLVVTERGVELSGREVKGVRFAPVVLEDMINLREAPFVKQGRLLKERLVTPRILHSGRAIDDFTNEHLDAMLHAGFDAIAIFVKGPDMTNTGHLDINDVIRRAASYGIETYLYSYLPAYKHPDDEDAKEFFESVYTRIMEYHNGAAGVMLVGESAQFPSKDPHTTGKTVRESVVDGIPDPKPAPGWYPCEDYPKWICMVRDAIRKAKPDAKVIFNTYNWGWTPEEMRRKFLEKMPKDVIIQITYDIFSKQPREGLPCVAMDYTASAAKPGFYFTSECRIAHECGLPILSTANTAGMTWDIGVIPYEPVPQQWIRRFKELDYARVNWGLTRFYDTHHYGWWPSVICDLGKAFFQSPQQDPEEYLAKLAKRDAGEGAELLLKAWNTWSDAINYLTPTNEDQYGPLRVGPAYPLIFHPNITRTMGKKEIAFPAAKYAHFGGGIVKTLYQPYENVNQPPGAIRYPIELRSLDRLIAMWKEGIALYEAAVAAAPERKREHLSWELNMGRFMLHAFITCRNTKQWWLLNQALVNATKAKDALETLDRIEALAKQEIENARQAIPYVQKDSRLGWEPSMEYVGDEWHINWKIRQVTSVINGDIADYRSILKLTAEAGF